MEEEAIRGSSSEDRKGEVRKKNCGEPNTCEDTGTGYFDLAVGQKFYSKKALERTLKILTVLQKFDFIVKESRPNLYVVQCWVPGSGVVPVHVAEALNLRYGLKVDYWKGHRTLKRARELVRGSYENGYAELPAYLYRIRRSNPGTMTRLKVDENDRFKSVFIAFDTENDDSWDWFFTQLSCVIPDDEGIVIISDRHKSIGKAVDINYPLANRGICTYHLHKNIMLRFRGSETFGLVKKAATAYRLSDFNVLLGQIEEMNPKLYAYLQRADVSKWSRVHFPGDRYNITTTNIAESLNKVLRPARSFPIVQLLDEIRSMLTRWFARCRVEAAQMSTVLTKGVEKLLQFWVL
ncbi:PREDICTED: uncharacterized protein LOC104748592 [Camelina sativa]|uniref:Uncharacterized protein LOC104748592 n=1 Tax=Camelina sativa TaxID=90675 RepID=A0ABM0WB98_CAMSA|nr:PREDICTED: uncharacterized protein LOC104748592 [Camelina sativa]